MRAFGCLLVMFTGVSFLLGQNLADDQIREKLLLQPPSSIVRLSQKEASHGHPGVIEIGDFVNADLDGSGKFSYFVALFVVKGDFSGFLRVFKQQDNDFIIVGEQDAARDVGGYQEQIELVDVNGDGIPEIKVSSMSHDAKDQYFSLFSWTGSSLHDMIGDVVGNSALEDIDNDGVMEIISDNVEGKGFDIFKLSGNTYKLFKTVKDDPSGLNGPDGTVALARAFCKSLEPSRFSLEEIQRVRNSKRQEEREPVRLEFGGLRDLKGKRINVTELDTTSVKVGANLTPGKVSIHPGEERDYDDDKDGRRDRILKPCGPQAGRVNLEINRADFLKGLQQLQPFGPLAKGDQVEVTLRGRLKDGTVVSTVVKAEITGARESGDHDRDRDRGKEHDDKDRLR